jgi:subtilisin family serine protease
VQLSQDDIVALNQHQPVWVIIELDQSQAEQAAANFMRRSGLAVENEVVLAERVAIYQRTKEQVLTALNIQLPVEDFTLKQDYSHLPMLTVELRSPRALQALLDQPNVKAVYSNVELRHALSASLPLIRQPETAVQGGRGAGTTVAVLDTRVDYTHSAFGSCSAPGGDCAVAVLMDFPDTNASDGSDGHGSNVAGIVLGVAPDARIAALNVFQNDGLARSNDIIAAIDWAIANRSTYNIVALNMSLGGGRFTTQCPNDVFATPVANARAAGILSAVASGNDAYKDSMGSPACVPEAVSVGAVYDAALGEISWSNCTDSNIQADQITCFSNSTDFLSLLAPGALIDAAGFRMGGTSMASPHVAGAIAVLRAAYPSEGVDSLLARLVSTGVPLTDANQVTTPRIDLLAAYTTDRTAHSLTISRQGTGSGNVTSQPSGINCGPQCRAEFAEGISVTLTATASSGSVFSGWDGACTGSATTCTVVMNAARNVTATFTASTGGLSLGQALGNTGLDWRTSGDASWQGVQLSDRTAGQSGDIGDNQTSELYTTLTGPGTLSFAWRVSSESGYDFLEFHVNGVRQFSISGETDWETRTVNIGPGAQEIRWVYRKDFSISNGEDAGWVNAVTFTPSQGDLPDLIVTQVTSPTIGISGGSIDASVVIANQGGSAVGEFRAEFFLSDDATITLDDRPTGWGCTFSGLASGASATCTGTIGVPSDIPTGEYYLGAFADVDGVVTDTNRDNNGRAAGNTIRISADTVSLAVSRGGLGTGKITSTPEGIDCGTRCSYAFASDTQVTLTAIPDDGSAFAGWEGDCSGTTLTCTVTLSSDRKVAANFDAVGVEQEQFPPNGQWPSGWYNPSGSNAPWQVSSQWANEGRYSLRSGAISHDQQSAVEVQGNFAPGEVQFTLTVSSESFYDRLYFWIDGAQQGSWSGDQTLSVSYPLSGGEHTLRWSYEKDFSVSSGQDAAWIDEVILPTFVSSERPDELTYARQVHTLFIGYFGRAPGIGGLNYYADLIDQDGGDYAVMLDDAVNSSEGQAIFGNARPEDVVRSVFQSGFGRLPQPSGLDYWTGLVAAGLVPVANLPFEIANNAGSADTAVLEAKIAVSRAVVAELDRLGNPVEYGANLSRARELMSAVVDPQTRDFVIVHIESIVANVLAGRIWNAGL